MLVIILAMIVIAVCIALLIFIIRYVIYVFTPEEENIYHPYDEIPDNDMKTYREWFSLDMDKRNLTMTKEEWMKNSNEEVISKAEYLRRKSAYYGQK